MRIPSTAPVLMLALVLAVPTSILAADDDAPAPTPVKRKAAKPAAKPRKSDLSAEQQRDLEQRIEALEQKQEMQYREEPGHPTGAPPAE